MSEEVSSGSADPHAPLQAPDPPQTTQQTASLDQIQSMLKAKDDTSRFVGLALLKTLLDNSGELRNDAGTVVSLWESISPKFLDRLVKAGSSTQSAQNDAKNMVDLAVSVIHIFALLLPDQSKRDKRLVGRLPLLVSSLLQSSEETSKLIVQTILTLVAFPEGAKSFLEVEDVSPLVEIAPSNSSALEVFGFSWINCMSLMQDRTALKTKIDGTVQALVSTFKGTDAVTFLEFLGKFLRNADPKALPSSPKWVKPAVNFIKKLLTSRPTPQARNAYTIAAASLLEVYPAETSRLLFTSDVKEDKPFSYLFITLLLTDTRATLPRLLELLNDPAYPAIAQRLGSTFDITTRFVGYLMRSLDDETSSPANMVMSADFLLKIRRVIAETMSLTIEFLRDRWDASVAGTFGLHPDAREKETDTSMGKRLPISWDSKKDNIHEDPLILAAIRVLSLWLREDDNDLLRKEAAGLTDMLIDLYKASSPTRLDFRSPILVGLEGILVEKAGLEEFTTHNGWDALTQDLLAILQRTSTVSDENEAARAIEIVRILLPIVESEEAGSREEWMDLVTSVAAWDAPEVGQPLVVQEAQVAVLQLTTALLVGAPEGMKRRYVHSTSAILGIAARLERHVDADHPLRESLVDVLQTLGSLR
ncbi:Neurochondrin-domain-containing protein [Colletotrichum navitas]|uniref:Neurochondrin-domain-containing protein n=1 Tax=Colletotrichum navitas TaxID=681940 RepID=A0AAD8VAY3_9PEZI|nr:Neurochondrin-domain-containing protein [Colletotrichum navitas]KAK1598593.1 Neurochondrin-domain-containing protein [Colletotrichum navitas]